MYDTKPCRKCGEDKPMSAYWLQPNGKRAPACYRCRNQPARESKRRDERSEFEAALRDDIWAAMHRARSSRALEVVRQRSDSTHRIKLRHERGFTSIAEFACRCAEHEACHRAANQCRSVDAVSAAERILEQPTATLERTKELSGLWRGEEAPVAAKELRTVIHGEDEEADPFDVAFGDWAPAWVQDAHASTQLTYSG